MAAVPFDTLKLAQRLEAAGFSGQPVGDTAEALAEAMSGAELATKSDLSALGAELKTEIAALGTEFKAEIALVRHEMEILRRDLTIRPGSMMILAVGILLAALRYLL